MIFVYMMLIIFLVLIVSIALFAILSVVLTEYKGFTRADLKGAGWESLRGKYWLAFGVTTIGSLLGGGIRGFNGGFENSFNKSATQGDFSNFKDFLSTFERNFLALTIISVAVIMALAIAVLFSTFVSNVIEVGIRRFFIQNMNSKPSLGELFFGFRKNAYWNIVGTMFLMKLYIFLWSLLFIIPGIIKAYEYYMVPYLLAENPEISREDAFRLSKEMMTGNKWRTYVLGLSFLGWEILGVICCGVGILFVSPYVMATDAQLFKRLRVNASSPNEFVS